MLFRETVAVYCEDVWNKQVTGYFLLDAKWIFNIVTCYANEDAFLIGNSVYYYLHQLLTTHNYYTITHLHSIKSLHANIPYYLFGYSGIYFENFEKTADR
jgi:hypothetical protein